MNRTRAVLAGGLIGLLGWASSARGQGAEDYQQLKVKADAIAKEIEACGTDVKCIERASAKLQKLLQESDLGMPAQPGFRIRPVTVTITNRVEEREIEVFRPDPETCRKGPFGKYDFINYVFEYRVTQSGELKHAEDWSSFELRSPRMFGPAKKVDFEVLTATGYHQGVKQLPKKRCTLEKYPDVGFDRVVSQPEGVNFQIIHMPPMTTQPARVNVIFTPVVAVARNRIPACTKCESGYIPTPLNAFLLSDLDESPFMGPIDKDDFVVTPKQMMAAARKGRFERKLEWTISTGENGSYSKNTLTITVVMDPSPGRLKVAPSAAFRSYGDDRGFTPSSKIYTLTNPGDEPVKFSVATKKSWLKASVSSGTLAPGASQKVEVSLTDAVKKLKSGKHTDSITFTNQTNGKGSTSRSATVEVGEYQVWLVKLTGQETDDMGGKEMYVKANDAWRFVTVNYGVRFDYVMQARVTIRKVKGKWKFSSGQIERADVKLSDNFDPSAFHVAEIRCRNCAKLRGLVGQSFSGAVDGNNLNLYWPVVVTEATVKNKLKLKHESVQESHKGYSYNEFESAEFLHRAHDHDLPRQNGRCDKYKVVKASYKQRSRLDKRPQISLSYYYYLKRLH